MTNTEQIETEADRDYEALVSPHPTAVARSLKEDPNYVKCPRCWHYHTVILNFDQLCDRCCHVMQEAWPHHPSTPHIKDNWKSQRAHFNRPEDALR